MKTVLEKNIEFEDELLRRCRQQFPERAAPDAVSRMLNRLEYQGRRNREIATAMWPEIQRVRGGQ